MRKPRSSKPKTCNRCHVFGPHEQGKDVCDRCVIRAKGCPVEPETPDEGKERRRLKMQRYRAHQKAKGLVDKSHGRGRDIIPGRIPKKRALKPPPGVAQIEAKDTARPVSFLERRSLTMEEAAQVELVRRELARRKLLHFIKRRNPKYLAAWMHDDICTRLERFSQEVADGLSPRLMLACPPRHGKSMVASEEFPPWHLGSHPEHQIIACSYASPLAYDFSRKVQAIVNSADYGLIFERCQVQEGIEAVDLWGTTAGGRYCATGVGGPLTGRGAHILLIDDPVKNREEAESPTQRTLIKNWYTSTAYPRLMPGGGVLIIQTRWHDDDLSGWLLACMREAQKEADANGGVWPVDADHWEVVEYPAVAIREETHRYIGEALHPARYPLSALMKIRRAVGERDWAALYQQTPVPEEGSYFTKEMMRYYEGAAPRGISVITACDLAISKADHANYSAIITVGVDEKDDTYVLDARRGKWDSAEIVNELITVQRQWRPQLMGIERTHVEMAIGPFLEKRIREEKLWNMVVEPLPPGKRDKQLRARPIQGRMRQGKVLFPKGRAFLEWLVPELLRFPNGTHDDGVDAMAWIGQLMNMVQYTPPTKPKLASWKDRLNALASAASHLRNPSMAA